MYDDMLYRIKYTLGRLRGCYYDLEPVSQDIIIEIDEILEELEDENIE